MVSQYIASNFLPGLVMLADLKFWLVPLLWVAACVPSFCNFGSIAGKQPPPAAAMMPSPPAMVAEDSPPTSHNLPELPLDVPLHCATSAIDAELRPLQLTIALIGSCSVVLPCSNQHYHHHRQHAAAGPNSLPIVPRSFVSPPRYSVYKQLL